MIFHSTSEDMNGQNVGSKVCQLFKWYILPDKKILKIGPWYHITVDHFSGSLGSLPNFSYSFRLHKSVLELK